MFFKNLLVGDFFTFTGKPKVYEKVGGCSAEGIAIFDNPFDLSGFCHVEKVDEPDGDGVVNLKECDGRSSPG